MEFKEAFLSHSPQHIAPLASWKPVRRLRVHEIRTLINIKIYGVHVQREFIKRKNKQIKELQTLYLGTILVVGQIFQILSWRRLFSCWKASDQLH